MLTGFFFKLCGGAGAGRGFSNSSSGGEGAGRSGENRPWSSGTAVSIRVGGGGDFLT